MDPTSTGKTFSNFVLDMDGVLYRGGAPLPGARELLFALRQHGCGVAFMSNNSAPTRRQYLQKLHRMGIEAREGEIIPSSLIAASYLRRKGGSFRLFVIGEAGLREELALANMSIIETPLQQEGVDYVVVGMDREFSYQKMRTAMRYILGGAGFIGTNPDISFPEETGLSPGAGALIAGIEKATGVPPIILGKPYPEALKLLLALTGFHRETTVMVGDRLDTDIVMAREAGMFSVLVLTGVTQKEFFNDDILGPDMIVHDLWELMEKFRLTKKDGHGGIHPGKEL